MCIDEFNGSVSTTEGTLDFGQPPIKNTSPCTSLKNNSSILIPSHFVVVTADQNTTKTCQRMYVAEGLAYATQRRMSASTLSGHRDSANRTETSAPIGKMMIILIIMTRMTKIERSPPSWPTITAQISAPHRSP